MGGENGIKIMHYVYLIYSKKLNKFYTGSTDDLKKRMNEHNSGKTQFTLRGIPWKLVYYEAFIEKVDAMREEKFLKSGKGRERRGFLLETFIGKMEK